ncbi:MAG: FecR domain-containing protein [Nitrospirae bacterium]|nr:FecR domain-containing protein [Nitrospirota bacterium]
MRSKRFKGIVSVIVVVTFIAYSRLSFSLEPSANILGDAVGSGNVEIKTTFNNWISIAGKTHPVVNGAYLRSGVGRISIILKDGARLELGKDSLIAVSGSRGTYAIDLKKGRIAFTVPDGIIFSVSTPSATVHVPSTTAAMFQKTNSVPQRSTKGIIRYDEKKTTVISINGKLMVNDPNGGAQMLAAGEAIYITPMGKGFNIIPAQLAEVEDVEEAEPIDMKKLAMIVVGSAAVIVGVALLISGSTSGDTGTASPSSP